MDTRRTAVWGLALGCEAGAFRRLGCLSRGLRGGHVLTGLLGESSGGLTLGGDGGVHGYSPPPSRSYRA